MLRICLVAPGGAASIAGGTVNNRGQTVDEICDAAGHGKLGDWLRGKIEEWNAAVAEAAASTPTQGEVEEPGTGIKQEHETGQEVEYVPASNSFEDYGYGEAGEQPQEAGDAANQGYDYDAGAQYEYEQVGQTGEDDHNGDAEPGAYDASEYNYGGEYEYEYDYGYGDNTQQQQLESAQYDEAAEGVFVEAVAEAEERRWDPTDGNVYTYAEFEAYYGAGAWFDCLFSFVGPSAFWRQRVPQTLFFCSPKQYLLICNVTPHNLDVYVCWT